MPIATLSKNAFNAVKNYVLTRLKESRISWRRWLV
jgi:hypothetical protein